MLDGTRGKRDKRDSDLGKTQTMIDYFFLECLKSTSNVIQDRSGFGFNRKQEKGYKGQQRNKIETR